MVNSVSGANPSETWVKAINFVFESGNRQGGLSREVLNFVSVIQNPLDISVEVDDLFRKYIGSKWIGKGANCIFPVTLNHMNTHLWSKDYWGRLRRYREKVDQIGFVVHRLKNKPHSKQLCCVTFDPELDMQPHRPFNPRMPCLIALDIKFRDGKLNLFAMFRSHDFGRKAYGNFIGLGKLLSMLSRETGYEVGEVVCFSVSAHIRMKEFNSVRSLLLDYKKAEHGSMKKSFRTITLETYNSI
jgi:thymidylate synthase